MMEKDPQGSEENTMTDGYRYWEMVAAS